MDPPPCVLEGRVVRTERRPRDASAVWPFGAAVQFVEPREDLAPRMRELAEKVGELSNEPVR